MLLAFPRLFVSLALLQPLIALIWVVSLVLLAFALISFFRLQMQKLEKQKNELKDKIAELEKKLSLRSNENEEQSRQFDEFKQQLDAAAQRYDALKQKNQASIGMVIHDLKNPLYTIMGLSSGQAAGSTLETCHETAKKMLRIVLNTLDLNKYEDMPLQLNISNFDVIALLNDVLNSLEYSLRNKSKTIALQCDGNYRLMADKALIGRVLENLLVNAISYSNQESPITLKIFEKSKKLRVEVANEGKPIAAEMKKAIFEPFVQQHPAKDGMLSTGLGLAFCKMAIETHRGRIGLTSSAGEPIVFWFELPDYYTETDTQAQGEKLLDFKSDFKWMSASMQNHSEFLVPLKSCDVYEMSLIINLLRQFTPPADDPSAQWKAEVEQAVYHCDNLRFKELVKLIGPKME